jgi:phosphatidylglycerol:prolipoprotein diacylglycerol transferase
MIMFHLPGGVPIYAFSLLLALGAALGLAWAIQAAPYKERLSLFDAGLWTLLGALLGGRAGYVLVNWSYFNGRPWQIPQFQLGGLSGAGALAGGVLALALVAWLRRRPIGALADALLPLLLILAVAAWLGCWLDGCAYGWSLSAWWAIPARDEWGLITPRWPVQLIGAVASLALLWLLELVGARLELRPGMLAGLGLLGLSAICFGLSFLRADVALTWQGLRLDAWGALALLLLALCAILTIQFTNWFSRKRS